MTTEQKTARDIETKNRRINHRICSELVRREVVHCASSMVSELLEISAQTPFESFQYEDLLELCQREDWESPARENLTILKDSAGDEYAFHADHIVFRADSAGIAESFHSDCYSAWDWFEGERGITLPDDWDFEEPGECQYDESGEEIFVSVTEYKISDSSLKLSDDYLWENGMACDDWREVCDEFELDPYQRESLEFWIVSDWFAGKLAEHGEMVGDVFDFKIWGRTTSGQSISMDGVIREIANEMEILHGQKYSWE